MYAYATKNEEGSTTVVSNDTEESRFEQSYGAKSQTICRGPMSRLMIFSFIVMIVGFTFATPISLLLTIPAYALADQVSTSDMYYDILHEGCDGYELNMVSSQKGNQMVTININR